jgi:hypothetical protein
MRRSIVAGLLCTLFISLPSAGWAAPRWGDFKKDSCTSIHNRQYSSVLWDIPFGQNWDAACRATAATIGGGQYSAARCKEAGGHMWGEFDVPDASCTPQWGDFSDAGCVAPGKRQYSSVLWNIRDLSWEAACRQMPASFNGNSFDRPTRCVNHGGHMWGEFDVADQSCP